MSHSEGHNGHADSSREEGLIRAAQREALGPRAEVSESSALGDRGWRAPLPADSIPGYEILREIHRGGQGAVYLAIQTATKRKVAIKVMHEGPFAGSRDRARFEREVQILGQLNHPNIVTIHNTGTAAGSFYFVMDYISGPTLDAYMAGGERSIDEILRLFEKICVAVNVAHLKGIIHRDLKPSNIRIDAHVEPHILDFGLAKVALGAITEAPRPQVMTVTGQFIGSMPWASPEQAAGNPDRIDLRTDVYSLGVVLFQMLTRSFPYAVAGNMRDILDNIIRAEPARPRGINPNIDDEVETIVLKALDKAPERRYQNAGELGRDVAHYLAGEPIDAKRDSGWYVLRKMLRRRKVPIVVTSAFVVLLVSFAATLLGLRFRAERRAVEIQAEVLQAVRTSLDPDPSHGEQSAARIEDELSRFPELQVQLHDTVAQIFRDVGQYADALPHLERVLELRRERAGGLSLDVAKAKHKLAATHWYNGDFDIAESLYRDALETRRRLFGDEHEELANGLNHLAACLMEQGNYRSAEARYREALEMRSRLFGGEHIRVAYSLNNLGKCYLAEGAYQDAEPLLREALELAGRLVGSEHGFLAVGMTNLAASMTGIGRFEEAQQLLDEALGRKLAGLGDGHPSVAQTWHRIAELRYREAKLGIDGAHIAAESACRLALGIRRGRLHRNHPKIAESLTLLGLLVLARGDATTAEFSLREALELQRKALPPGHWLIAQTESAYGACLAELERYGEAESLLVNSYPVIRAVRGDDDTETRAALLRLIGFYESSGDAHTAAEYRRMLGAR